MGKSLAQQPELSLQFNRIAPKKIYYDVDKKLARASCVCSLGCAWKVSATSVSQCTKQLRSNARFGEACNSCNHVGS
jgi:hypothetical protein